MYLFWRMYWEIFWSLWASQIRAAPCTYSGAPRRDGNILITVCTAVMHYSRTATLLVTGESQNASCVPHCYIDFKCSEQIQDNVGRSNSRCKGLYEVFCPFLYLCVWGCVEWCTWNTFSEPSGIYIRQLDLLTQAVAFSLVCLYPLPDRGKSRTVNKLFRSYLRHSTLETPWL